MKKTLFVFAMFVALMISSSLKAQTFLDFTLVNNTGEDLYGVYVSETVNESWGSDIIPTDILKQVSKWKLNLMMMVKQLANGTLN